MSEQLANRKCKPCEGGVDPLDSEAIAELMRVLNDDWKYDESARLIRRLFEFPSYARTMAFVNVVAWVATNEGHHPELYVTYGSCRVDYQTHAIGGLSDNDFICAAKIDRLADQA